MTSELAGRQTISWGSLFSLDLPASWTWTDDDGVISLFGQEHPVGALQISLARRSRPGLPTETEARELAEAFASQRGWDSAHDDVRTFEIAGYPASHLSFVERGDDPCFVEIWHVVGPKYAAFVTYTCDPNEARIEAHEREEIAQSFRWL